jgi:DNA-binding transcriptional LysR family regulator
MLLVDKPIYTEITFNRVIYITKKHSDMLIEQNGKDKRPSLRELEALHALIDGRKTTAAASMLGISQPAISRAIQDLEDRLGKRLFNREGGRLVATADGIQLYHDSQPVFQALDRLGRGQQPILDGEVVRLIASPTIAHRFIPGLVASFHKAEPGVRMLIEIGITADVMSKTAEGSFDIGISDARLHHPSIIFEPVRRAVGHVILPVAHPLAQKTELGPLDLHQQPFIALTRRFSVRTTLDHIFRNAGSEPREVIEAATSSIAYELVRAGVGLTLLNPFPLAFRLDQDVVFRPFTPQVLFETSFVLSTAAPASTAARRFMDFVRLHQPEDGYSTPLR